MQEVDFPPLLDKTLHADLNFYAYCPSQDIIACCFGDHISCHRLNWQRLWVFQQGQEDSPPTALVWHPEARFLGVGFESGLVILLNPENGELCGRSQAATSPVTSMNWLEEEEGTNAGCCMPEDHRALTSEHTFGSMATTCCHHACRASHLECTTGETSWRCRPRRSHKRPAASEQACRAVHNGWRWKHNSSHCGAVHSGHI